MMSKVMGHFNSSGTSGSTEGAATVAAFFFGCACFFGAGLLEREEGMIKLLSQGRSTYRNF